MHKTIAVLDIDRYEFHYKGEGVDEEGKMERELL